jgi:hypothetical protein
MVIHHSLNNILWDTRRSLLDIPNERAAEEFTELLLRGIAHTDHNPSPAPRTTSGGVRTGANDGEKAKHGAAGATRAKKKKQ